MSVRPADDPALKRFRAGLDKLYGNRIERVVLFGSRARGDAREDSDYDIAVFLKDMPDRWVEIDKIAELQIDLLDACEADFTVLPFKASDYDRKTGLMYAIRTQGVPL